MSSLTGSPPSKRNKSFSNPADAMDVDNSPLAQSKRKRAIIESSLQLTAAISTAETTIQGMDSASVEPGMTALLEGFKTTIMLLTNALRSQQTLLDNLLHTKPSVGSESCTSEDVRLEASAEIASERRSRCVVVANMSEATEAKATDRQLMDEQVVGELLNRLNIQCRPLSVYRVGKQFTDQKGHKRPRFTFIEFPNRSFALDVLRFKHHLRQKKSVSDHDFSNVYLEPPMSKEERARAYEARVQRRKAAGSSTESPKRNTRFDQQFRNNSDAQGQQPSTSANAQTDETDVTPAPKN